MKLPSNQRFWLYVNKNGPIHPILKTPCWNWIGGTSCGYGHFKVGLKTFKAHRYSWILQYGPIPEKMCICHHCDNPICVNIEHLFLGTAKENTQDSIHKGRRATPSAKLTLEQACQIRKLYSSGLFTQQKLANQFHIDQVSVSKIITNHTYKE